MGRTLLTSTVSAAFGSCGTDALSAVTLRHHRGETGKNPKCLKPLALPRGRPEQRMSCHQLARIHVPGTSQSSKCQEPSDVFRLGAVLTYAMTDRLGTFPLACWWHQGRASTVVAKIDRKSLLAA